MFKKTDKNSQDSKNIPSLDRGDQKISFVNNQNTPDNIKKNKQDTAYNPTSANITSQNVDSSNIKYAGFWRRFGAWNLDMMILTPIYLVLVMLLSISGVVEVDGQIDSESNIIWIICTIIAALYFSLQESSDKQATFGKRMAGIKVTDIDHQKLSTKHAFGRYIAAILNYLTLFIGYIMIGLTKNKQGLHDLVAKTQVLIIEKSSFWKWYIILLIANIAIIIAAWFMIFAAIFGTMMGEMMSMAGDNIKINMNSSTETKTIESEYTGAYIVPKINNNSYSEEDYKRLLSSSKITFEKGTGFKQYTKIANLGPIAIAQGSFFSSGKNPQVWVEVKLIELPDVNFFNAVKLHVNYILSANNKDLFDREYAKKFSFGKKKIGDIQLTKNSLIDDKKTTIDESKLLYGIGSATLRKGATEDKIAGISGYVELKLPLNIENTIFNVKDDIDDVKTTKNSLDIKIKDLAGKSIKIEIANLKDTKPVIVAYDVEGKKINNQMWSRYGANGKSNYKYTFDKAPATIVVTTSSGIYTKRFPFILGKKYKKNK